MRNYKKGQIVNVYKNALIDNNLFCEVAKELKNENLILIPLNLVEEMNFLTPYMKKIYGLDKRKEYIEASKKSCHFISNNIEEFKVKYSGFINLIK